MIITKELHKWCFCDVFAIDTGQWYLSTRKMTENCPEMYMCGTKFPIWLKGNTRSTFIYQIHFVEFELKNIHSLYRN